LAIHRSMQELVQPLAAARQPLADWAERLRSVLASVYGERQLNRDIENDRYLLATLEYLQGAFDDLAAVPAALQPRCDARQACRFVLDSLAGQGIAPPANPHAIEL